VRTAGRNARRSSFGRQNGARVEARAERNGLVRLEPVKFLDVVGVQLVCMMIVINNPGMQPLE